MLERHGSDVGEDMDIGQGTVWGREVRRGGFACGRLVCWLVGHL